MGMGRGEMEGGGGGERRKERKEEGRCVGMDVIQIQIMYISIPTSYPNSIITGELYPI